jgi:hypothetical protein
MGKANLTICLRRVEDGKNEGLMGVV